MRNLSLMTMSNSFIFLYVSFALGVAKVEALYIKSDTNIRKRTIFKVRASGVRNIYGQAGEYEDDRCKCVCPSQTVVNASETGRKVYILKVPPNQCKCEFVVRPLPDKFTEFCPRCECKYQSRNITLIKGMVIVIICVVSLLFVYMVFLLCLDPLLVQKPGRYQEYTNEEPLLTTIENQHYSLGCGDAFSACIPTRSWNKLQTNSESNTSEDDQSVSREQLPQQQQQQQQPVPPCPPPPPPHPPILTRQRSILNRVSDEQKKWKGTVQEQRRNIYDRHSMLN